jgi:hypothetical protein
MKKYLHIVLALAFALIMPMTQPNGLASLLIAGLVVAAILAPAPKHTNGASAAGISREIWEAHIQENLFPNNEFLLDMMDESEYVNYKTVHSPQSGAAPTVTVNPTFPLNSGNGLAVSTRSDTVTDWNIDVFMTNPFIITNAEEVELSYNKRESVLYETEMQLRKVIADKLLVNIAPTGAATLPDTTTNSNVLRSTGVTNNDLADVRSSAAYTTSATGNRLNFTLYDIRQAKKLFDKQNVPSEDRAMIMSPDAADQIINDLIVTKFRQDAMNAFDTTTGKIEKLLGFKVHVRSQVVQYSNAATPVVKAYGASGAADDNDAILFFQKAFVARAVGDIHVYEQLNSPTHGGDIYSALIRMGATKKRTSELGVGAIVQTASV